MVDTISDDDAERIGKVIDQTARDQGEVEDAIEDRFGDWEQSQLEGFADRISERRQPVEGVPGEKVREHVRDKSTLSGSGVTGKRTTMQKDAQGKFLGKSSDVTTYTDQWGNVMGHNKSTGKRSKLIDSSEL